MPIRVRITNPPASNTPQPYEINVMVDDYGPGQVRASFKANVILTVDGRHATYVAGSASPAAPNSREQQITISWADQVIAGSGAVRKAKFNRVGTAVPRFQVVAVDLDDNGKFSIAAADWPV